MVKLCFSMHQVVKTTAHVREIKFSLMRRFFKNFNRKKPDDCRLDGAHDSEERISYKLAS